ncbi:MAG: hypothetical protein OXF98_02900, partial [Rhodospirillaceae bacterium]|nr:hypothetical protein [Rhodospirillaceae bacterium]
MKTPPIVLVALPLLAVAASAQDSGAPPAIYKPSIEIMAELNEAEEVPASAGGGGANGSPGDTER